MLTVCGANVLGGAEAGLERVADDGFEGEGGLSPVSKLLTSFNGELRLLSSTVAGEGSVLITVSTPGSPLERGE
jgi:hypothetical protein